MTVTGKIAQLDIQKTSAPVKWSLFAICAIISLLVLLVYVGLVIGALSTAGATTGLSP